jgi:hypothetical protein
VKIAVKQRVLAVATCAALLAVSCASTVAPSPAPSASPSRITTTASPPGGTPVGSLFDPPPPAPGYQWTRNGAAVAFNELSTAAGSEHCEMQSATIMRIGWPLGTISNNRLDSRQYIRDPQGVITGKPFRQRLDLNATVPSDGRDTGYRYAAIVIHLSPSDQDEFIYLVGPAGAERWPRSDPMTLCF